MTSSILIVEDETIVSLDISRHLRRLGYKIAGTCISGEEALRLVPEKMPHLILMDVHLQGDADGIETAEIILKDYNIPIIILTAFTDDQTISRAREIGPYGYIVKPFSERVLRTSIEMALVRHALEKEIQVKQQLFEATLNSISDSVIVTDDEGRVRFINPVAQRLLAFPEIGETFPGTGCRIRQEEDETYTLILGTGKRIPIELQKASLQDKGQPGTLWALRDISHRRALEEQLQQTHKMEALGRLAGGIAHDFNNILTVILGYCSLMLETEESREELLKDARGIRGAAKKAVSLTRQLLVFSRQQVVEIKGIPLVPLITSWMDMFHRLLGKDIHLTFFPAENDSEAFLVQGNEAQIEQALINLIVNARDALPQGGEIKVSLHKVLLDEPHLMDTGPLQPGSYGVISVTDNGRGIDRETRKRIFDPFFTTKDDLQGTGLGLATVYGIIKQLGGGVSLQSIPGEGSCFSLYLPSSLDESPGEPASKEEKVNDQGESEPVDSLFPRHYRNETYIYLVQSDESLRQLLEKALSVKGFTLKTFPNPGDALFSIEYEDTKPQLLICDLVMPWISGPHYLTKMRSHHDDLKCLFVTELTEDQAQAKIGKTGDALVIHKPFTTREMEVQIARVLDLPTIDEKP